MSCIKKKGSLNKKTFFKSVKEIFIIIRQLFQHTYDLVQEIKRIMKTHSNYYLF